MPWEMLQTLHQLCCCHGSPLSDIPRLVLGFEMLVASMAVPEWALMSSAAILALSLLSCSNHVLHSTCTCLSSQVTKDKYLAVS